MRTPLLFLTLTAATTLLLSSCDNKATTETTTTATAPETTTTTAPADSSAMAAPGAIAATYYTCPMHPEVHSDQPGKCPKCGMNLVKASTTK